MIKFTLGCILGFAIMWGISVATVRYSDHVFASALLECRGNRQMLLGAIQDMVQAGPKPTKLKTLKECSNCK